MTRRVLLFFFGILVLGSLLRFIRLTSWPIFADESIYVRWSQVMRAESTLRFLPLSDGKQPLFMWVTIPFFKLITDPLQAARTVSALAGIATTFGIGLLSWLLYKNSRIALFSVLLWTVLPYTVFFNRLALVDSLLTLFVVCGVCASLISITKQRLDAAMIAGFFFGFAWLTKSPAMITLLLLPSLLVLLSKFTPKNLLVSCGLLLVTWCIAFGMYNILRLGPEFHQIALRNKDYVFSFGEILNHPFDPLVSHLKDSINFYFYFLTPLGLVFVFWGIFAGRFAHPRPTLVLAIWLLVPIFGQSAIAKAYTARYLLFTVPFAIILLAHAIEHLGQHTKNHRLSLLALALVLVPSLVADYLVIYQPEKLPLPRIERSGYLEEWTAGQGLKEVSDYVRQAAKIRSVVVGSEGYFGTPFDALQTYLNGVSNVRVVGVGVWIDSVDEKLLNASRDNQVFLVVNSTRFHNDEPEKLGLKLLASYPKGLRPDGTREYLLFFQYNSK